jgi:hypothetical protein
LRFGVQLESKRGYPANLSCAHKTSSAIRGTSLLLEKPAIPDIFSINESFC